MVFPGDLIQIALVNLANPQETLISRIVNVERSAGLVDQEIIRTVIPRSVESVEDDPIGYYFCTELLINETIQAAVFVGHSDFPNSNVGIVRDNYQDFEVQVLQRPGKFKYAISKNTAAKKAHEQHSGQEILTHWILSFCLKAIALWIGKIC